MIIETERLILRRWRESDAQVFASINSDPQVMEFMPSTLTRAESDEMIARIESHFEEHGFGLCAAELRESGTLAGFIGLSIPRFKAPFTPCVEIGWRLAREEWGRGLATEGARAMLDYARQLGLKQVVSFTVPANARSRRVMQKIGMTYDPADDFEHPALPAHHPLRRHVLYRLVL